MWSVYWYNGDIYGSEIARGVDVFKLVPNKYITQNEIDASNQVHFDELNEGLNSEVGKRHHAVFSGAIDPDKAVLGVHFIGDVMEAVDAFAEAFGDAVYGRDVIDLVDVHVQAASAGAP